MDLKAELTALGVGEASVLDAGIPMKVEQVLMIPLSGQVRPISVMERSSVIDVSPIRSRYGAKLQGAETIHSFCNRSVGSEAFRRRPLRVVGPQVNTEGSCLTPAAPSPLGAPDAGATLHFG